MAKSPMAKRNQPSPQAARFQLNALRVKNFTRFIDQEFRFHPQFTVLIGDNASGKTSLLDAASIALASYTTGVPDCGRGIAKDQVHHEFRYNIKARESFLQIFFPCELHANGSVGSEKIKWSRFRTADRMRSSSSEVLVKLGVSHRLMMQIGQDVTIPLLCYYGTGRLWDEPREIKPSAPESRLAGYRQALTGKSTIRQFLRTMERLTYGSIQARKPSPLLTGIVNAVKACIPACEDLYFDINRSQLVARIAGRWENFGMLSHGYRGMLGLVADLAYRASILNPHFGAEAALKSPGVVLIDELDLHLHPSWQREVVKHLQIAFPLVQFIAATHSPFIVQSLEPGQLLDLNSPSTNTMKLGTDEFIAHPAPDANYSERGVEEIAEAVMGVESAHRSARFVDAELVAKSYLQKLSDIKGKRGSAQSVAKGELDQLLEKISDNPAAVALLKLQRAAKLKE